MLGFSLNKADTIHQGIGSNEFYNFLTNEVTNSPAYREKFEKFPPVKIINSHRPSISERIHKVVKFTRTPVSVSPILSLLSISFLYGKTNPSI